jgi:protein SCO1/2
MKHIINLSGIVITALLFSSCNSSKKESEASQLVMPVIGEKKLGGQGTDTIYHSIGSFSLTNQYRETVTQKDVENKIYVADFFFATCQSICPQMSTELIRVQEAFKDDKDFLILSHSVNPAHDTVEVLEAYAGKYKAIKGKWHFLTGSKKAIYDLALNDYLVNALEDDGSEEGFIHSELLLLIDKHRRIRGMYDGTDSIAVNKLIKDIKLLKTEK